MSITADTFKAMDYSSFSANRLTIHAAKSKQELRFGKMKPKSLTLWDSEIGHAGINYGALKELTFRNSKIHRTTFKMTKLDSLSIYESSVEVSKLSPHLKEIGTLTLETSTIKSISLPLTKVTGTINLVDNLAATRISFPHLKTVGRFNLENGKIKTINLPVLKRAKRISLKAKISNLNIPTTVKVTGSFVVYGSGLCRKKRQGFQFPPKLIIKGCLKADKK